MKTFYKRDKKKNGPRLYLLPSCTITRRCSAQRKKYRSTCVMGKRPYWQTTYPLVKAKSRVTKNDFGLLLLDAAQWVARRQMILRNAKAMMAKAQDRYASAVNKKRREMTFHMDNKVWLDSKN